MDNISLKFDIMEKVDIQLANEYFKKHNNEFRSIGLEECSDVNAYISFNKVGNKIFCTEPWKAEDSFKQGHDEIKDLPQYYDEIRKKFFALEKEIEQNAELFSQIEAVTRFRKKEDICNCDIKLIMQNLRYCGLNCKPQYLKATRIMMLSTTPLAALGFVAQLLLCDSDAVILATVDTAVVCHLFTQLCHGVGLSRVRLVNLEGIAASAIYLHSIKELETGCSGVICERSDMYSAVDALLCSSDTYPWALSKIWIQEIVYDAFKKLLAWKCKTMPACQLNENVQAQCADTFHFRGKNLLLDYVGDVTHHANKHVVLVEAYRTTKELLCLLAKEKPYCVSLWCSDVAEANEIAYGVDASLIWLNDVFVFDGPPRVSQTFFSPIVSNYSLIEYLPLSAIDNFRTVHKSWLRLSPEKRSIKLSKALEAFKDQTENKTRKLVESMEDAVFHWQPGMGNFVDMQKNRLCVGRVTQTPDVFFVRNTTVSNHTDVLIALMNGCGVVIADSKTAGDTVEKLWEGVFRALEKQGVPILAFDGASRETDDSDFQVKGNYCPRTSVVWTNVGTIFAN